MKRLFRLMPLVVATLAVSTALSTAAAAPTRAAANPPPAPSATTTSITQAATWYYYKPGHPMMIAPNVPWCTGAWAIRGTSGMFFLTAGHCRFNYYSGGRVYGTKAQFGTQRRTEYGKGMDALIVQPLAGVDAYQRVTARNWPGGTIGNTVGLLHNANFHQNGPIGMSGWTSGWITGRLRGQSTWIHGERVFLTNYNSHGGDSGGPVLINDGARHVWAAGMHVGLVTTSSGTYAAFISIDDLLARFGARLPVFPRVAAPAATADTGTELPQLKALGYVLQ